MYLHVHMPEIEYENKSTPSMNNSCYSSVYARANFYHFISSEDGFDPVNTDLGR